MVGCLFFLWGFVHLFVCFLGCLVCLFVCLFACLLSWFVGCFFFVAIFSQTLGRVEIKKEKKIRKWLQHLTII